MSEKPDDLEAVRTIVTTLQPFEQPEKERILRWATEKLGISPAVYGGGERKSTDIRSDIRTSSETSGDKTFKDIKSFVNEKNPSSDNQFAATVAYYYAFEAPEDQKRQSISSEDLQDACRQSGRTRLGDPGKTLRNAHSVGLLDKAGDRGAFKINTVGENLVAVTLPSGSGTAVAPKRTRAKKR